MLKFTEKEFQNEVQEFMGSLQMVDSCFTFDEVGLLTNNKGLVVTLKNKQKFQVTIKEVK